MKKIDIHFDKFSFESDIISQNNTVKIFELLKNKNLLYEGILDNLKVKKLIVGNLENNYYSNLQILVMIMIDLLKNLMVNGHILQMMHLTIMIK